MEGIDPKDTRCTTCGAGPGTLCYDMIDGDLEHSHFSRMLKAKIELTLKNDDEEMET